MTEPVEAQGISFLYPGGRGVREASFSAGKGEILCILGPNGSGKSTLFRVLSTLARPHGGTLLINGQDAFRHRDEARRAFFPVPDETGHLASLSGMENLEMVLGLYHDGWRDRVGHYAGHLRLDLDIPAGSYSLGMKRKLLLVEALLSGRDILFFDEPTLGLDSPAREAFFRFLEERAGAGGTVVFGTNRRDEAARAGRVIGMADGKITGEPPGDTPAGLFEVKVVMADDEFTEYALAGDEIPGIVARAITLGIPRRIEIRVPDGDEVVWTPGALEKVGRAPGFVRKMITGLAERHAREQGIRLITPEVLDEVKGRFERR